MLLNQILIKYCFNIDRQKPKPKLPIKEKGICCADTYRQIKVQKGTESCKTEKNTLFPPYLIINYF